MCEIIIIAVVFMAAIEIKCGELFNARPNDKTAHSQLRQTINSLPGKPNDSNLGSNKSVSILQSRKYQSEAAKEVDAANNKNM